MNGEVKIKKIDERAKIPTFGSQYAAGADLYALVDDRIIINPGETSLIRTGFAIQIPEGYAGFIYARSGLASKKGLAPANKVGVIDSDYRGEVMVALYNHGNEPQMVEFGERIAQLVIAPFYKPNFVLTDELDDTLRSSGGFGSTGS